MPVKAKVPVGTTYPYHEKDIAYGIAHNLQYLDICLPRPLEESKEEKTVWVIFIHGGAWRAMKQDKSELQPALSHLLASDSSSPALNRIAGFASLNYGLSCYPPSDESEDLSLRVQHPTHITDVVLALAWLRENYSVGDEYNYFFIGHSAGATLSFQTLLHHCTCNAATAPALAVVGLAGIYDLPLLLKNHEDEPYYKFFVDSAFGSPDGPPSIKTLEDVSPVSGEYERTHDRGGLKSIIFGWSEGDVLVEKAQWEAMSNCLEKQGWRAGSGSEGKEKKEIIILELEGTHDDIWELGDGVRKGIELAIERLFPSQ